MPCSCLGSSVQLIKVRLGFVWLGRFPVVTKNFIILSPLMVLVGLLRCFLQFWLGCVCFVWVYSLIWCRRGPLETLMMLITTIRVNSTYRTSSVVTVLIHWLYIAVVVVIFQSVRNYNYWMRNILEEGISHLVEGTVSFSTRAFLRRVSFTRIMKSSILQS
jgi:hypothetical protein